MPDFRVIPSIDVVRQRPAAHALARQFGDGAVLGALRESTAALRERLADAVAPVTLTGEDATHWIEQDASTRLRRRDRALVAAGHQRHRRHRAHEPGAGPAVAGGAGAHRRDRRRLQQPRVRPAGGPERRRATRTPSPCSAASRAPRRRWSSTTARRRRCWRLSALARGREVVISRAELVEIGGGFRVPDIMAQSGARLREVGTTNRTRIGDYALAIGDRTGALLRVHPSNFRIEGFTERAPLADLVALARRFSLPLIEDLGSGHVGAHVGRRGGARRRAHGAAERRGRRRRGVLQRRQAARRAAGRRHRGAQRVGVAAAQAPADARAARGQAHLRGARSHAGGAPGRTRVGHRAGVADGEPAGRGHRGARRDPGGARCGPPG